MKNVAEQANRVLAFVASGVFFACGAAVDDLRAGVDTTELEAVGIPSSRLNSPAPYQTLYRDDNLFLRVTYGSALLPSDSDEIAFWERKVVNGSWVDSHYTFTSSFLIDVIRPKSKYFFYIVGRSGSGDLVIERWKRKSVSMPGGDGGLTFKKSEVYRGSALLPLKAFGVDPDGRYLYVAHGAPTTLSRLDLPGSSPTPVFTEATIPHLADVSSMYVRDHVSEGRVWTLTSVNSYSSGDRTLLYDFDNDGAIDTWASLSYEEYRGNGYGDQDAWVRNFIQVH